MRQVNKKEYIKTMAISSFQQLKQEREALTERFKQKTSPSQANFKDARYWEPTLDELGNAKAVLRFLPAPPNEEDSYVCMYTHAFQASNGWYIENSLTSIGQKDPVGELNRADWNNGEEGKERAKNRKRKANYISNVYIVSDPANPDAEGKVFLYKYVKQIFDFQKACLVEKQSLDPDEPPLPSFNPFDMWNGANFNLNIERKEINIGNRKVKVPDYDKSYFGRPKPLFSKSSGEADEDKMEAVWQQCYSLADEIAPSKFKTYETLKKRLNKVMGVEDADDAYGTSGGDEEMYEDVAPTTHKSAKPKPQKADTRDEDFYTGDFSDTPMSQTNAVAFNDDDEWLSKFRSDIEGEDIPF